jgi:hypothetical protein
VSLYVGQFIRLNEFQYFDISCIYVEISCKTILGIKKNEVKNVEKLFEEVKELVILTIFIASGIQCWDVFACA